MRQLDRQILTTSRDLDFLTERELSAQVGFAPEWWREVAAKELVDNALDACEDAGIAPEIAVETTGGIRVTDNGPGIPPEVVTRIADYSTRTSSREAYAGLSRGAQGNAWMTLLAMPHALGGGFVTIASHGIEHRLTLKPHPLTGKIDVLHETSPSDVKNGTSVTVNSPRWIDASDNDWFYVLTLLALTNPAASISLNGQVVMPPSTPAKQRWANNRPAPAHWYNQQRFKRLLTARLAADQDLPIRAFLKDFDGMAGTARQRDVAASVGVTGARLDAILHSDGSLNDEAAKALHSAICCATKSPKAESLGRLGEAAMRRYCGATGAGFLNYTVKKLDEPNSPAVIEVLVVCDDTEAESHVVLINGTAPPTSGNAGLDGAFPTSVKSEEAHEAGVLCIVNISCPAVTFADRGKRNVILPPHVRSVIGDCIARAAKPWTDNWKKMMRKASSQPMRPQKPKAVSIREAAWDTMLAAYKKASAGGTLPAAPRQIMYAARGEIQRLTGKPLDSKYFTQTLLWDFIEEHPDLTASWKIAVDPRGNLVEPHTGRRVPLGTLPVEDYLFRADKSLRLSEDSDDLQFAIADVRTHGPKFRFGADWCSRPRADLRNIVERCSAASPERPFVDCAAFGQPKRRSADEAPLCGTVQALGSGCIDLQSVA